VVGGGAQAAGDGAAAALVEQVEGGVAQQAHHGGSGPGVDRAAVRAEGDVLDAVQSVLDLPLASLEGEQAGGVGVGGREAGDAVVPMAVPAPAFPPGSFQAEDLSEPRSVEVAGQVGGGDQVSPVVGPTVAPFRRRGRTAVEQRQPRGQVGGRVEEQGQVA